MIIAYSCLLVVACITTAASSSEFSLKGDPCSKFDSCFSKPLTRTCSCDSNCEVYGTCCHDMQKDADSAGHAASFRCYHHRTSAPVFAKRSCLDDFKGHVGDKVACLDEEQDDMDVKSNLLVTSHKTKITYWNKMCARCNDESKEDLEFWNIEVFCPARESVNRYLIRRNLTLNQDKNEWGLQIGEEFLRCIVKYAPPTYIDEVKHCTPNLISSCPSNYSNEDTATKCSQYYAERKLKNSDTYYKNIHCAICNGADVKDLECPGMTTAEDNGDETDFGDMVEEVFTSNDWYNGRLFLCSKGHIYDPLREMCRKYEFKNYTTETIPNSASILRETCLALLAIIFVLLY